MVAAQENNDQPGAGEQEVEFVDNTMDLDGIPQLELPFEDAVTNDMKNLFRALIINQQNIISNCSFLYKRLQEIGVILQRLSPNTPPDSPQTHPIPPAELPSLYSVPEE